MSWLNFHENHSIWKPVPILNFSCPKRKDQSYRHLKICFPLNKRLSTLHIQTVMVEDFQNAVRTNNSFWSETNCTTMRPLCSYLLRLKLTMCCTNDVVQFDPSLRRNAILNSKWCPFLFRKLWKLAQYKNN